MRDPVAKQQANDKWNQYGKTVLLKGKIHLLYKQWVMLKEL